MNLRTSLFCVVRGWVLAAILALAAAAPARPAEELPPGLEVVSGPVNGAFIRRGGKILAVYGDAGGRLAEADRVLFTHYRRDVVWAGRALVESGAKAVVPDAEKDKFSAVAEFWAGFKQARFHDYAQQSTKVLGQPLAVDRAVKGGETLDWQGLAIRVLDTPGYTRGAVSYLIDLEGTKVAFTGDLICGDGRLWDLYSLQDGIPEAKIGGYHGHAARLGQLMSSLERLQDARPDLLVPARGPLIRDPVQAISRLRSRIRAFYANYLSIDALRWYFGDDHIRAKAGRVLGPEAKVDWMEMAETVQKELPPWITAISNTRLIRAADGSGFLVDCGGQDILDHLKRQRAAGTLASLDHLFITHYHDDHTDRVPDLLGAFGSTVYACPQMVDVLEHPDAYRLPAMTARPIPVSARLADGASWRWKEFDFRLGYFPGQTLYHQALLVKKDGGGAICFVGDSFTPSGIDDYCLLNRNFLHPDTGYFQCLDRLRRLPPDCLLINEHVGPAFRFSLAQIERMEGTLRRRVDLLRELLPWEDPNLGLDEGWAVFRPYAASARPGAAVRGAVILMNHSPAPQEFRVKLRSPAGWTAPAVAPLPVRLPSRQEGAVFFSLEVPANAAAGVHLLTADVAWGNTELREWCEMMVEVGP